MNEIVELGQKIRGQISLSNVFLRTTTRVTVVGVSCDSLVKCFCNKPEALDIVPKTVEQKHK